MFLNQSQAMLTPKNKMFHSTRAKERGLCSMTSRFFFLYEVYENHNLIDLFFEQTVKKHCIQQSLFHEDLKSDGDKDIIEQIKSLIF